MRSTTPMKVAKIGYIFISLFFCALGILLIALPTSRRRHSGLRRAA